MKRFLFGGLIILLTVGSLSGQSLVDLAKKEKARRAGLQGKKGPVITNADLKKIDKAAALISPPTRTTLQKNPQMNTPVPTPVIRSTAPDSRDQDARSQSSSQSEELEERWMRARQLVDLLTTKMNGLWQEFYTLDDMMDRGEIQRQISETYLSLQKAQQEASQIKDELDRKKR